MRWSVISSLPDETRHTTEISRSIELWKWKHETGGAFGILRVKTLPMFQQILQSVDPLGCHKQDEHQQEFLLQKI